MMNIEKSKDCNDPFYVIEPMISKSGNERSVSNIIYRHYLEFFHDEEAKELAATYVQLHQEVMMDNPLDDPFSLIVVFPGYAKDNGEKTIHDLIWRQYKKHLYPDEARAATQQYKQELLSSLDREPYTVISQELLKNPEAEGEDKEEAFIVIGKQKAEKLCMEITMLRPYARVKMLPLSKPSMIKQTNPSK